MKRVLLPLAALALTSLGCAAAEPAPVTPSAPAKAVPGAQPLPAKTAPPAVPETTVDLAKGTAAPTAAPSGDEDAEGTREKGEEGTMGKPDGDADGDAKADAKHAVAQAGILGLLKSDGSSGSASSIFGRDSALGEDPLTAKGNIFGEGLGDAFGAGGLGLVGTGTGGGGAGSGTIGLGSIGTIGHGAGTGTGSGFGSGMGRLASARTPAPQVTVGTATVGPALDADIVKRIVRRNINRLRYCYEKALVSKPALAGKVTVKFTIKKDGSVTGAASSGSDLPDKDVIACVVNTFAQLSFPEPHNGVPVIVTYPMAFKPGDAQTPAATPSTTAKPADPLSSTKPAASAPSAPSTGAAAAAAPKASASSPAAASAAPAPAKKP
jgi:hypothetical protein